MVLVVLEATISRGKRPDGLPVSMVLTLTPHRRCMPERNRRIPTIPAGRTDAGPANVSTVDTGPRRSKSGVLTAEPGASLAGPATPTPRRLPYPAPATRVPSHVTKPTS